MLDISPATIERISHDRFLIRFKPGVNIDNAVIAEIAAQRIFPFPDLFAVIAIVPDNAQFEMEVMNTDHFAGRPGHGPIKLIAVVAEGSMFSCLTELYFGYFPQAFPVKPFHRLEDAISWVDDLTRARSVA